MRFLKIAKGSSGEVRNQLYVALAVNYVSKKEFDDANVKLENLASQIGAFIVYLQKKKANKEFLKK